MDFVLFMRFFVSALSALLLGMNIVVAWRYGRRWALLGREDKRCYRGLLPFHVWTVAASYSFLLLHATLEVYFRIGSTLDPTLTWRAPILISAYILGIIAMWSIFNLGQRNMLKIDVHHDQ